MKVDEDPFHATANYAEIEYLGIYVFQTQEIQDKEDIDDVINNFQNTECNIYPRQRENLIEFLQRMCPRSNVVSKMQCCLC